MATASTSRTCRGSARARCAFALQDPRRRTYRLAWARRGDDRPGVERVHYSASVSLLGTRRDAVGVSFDGYLPALVHVEERPMPRRRGTLLLFRCPGCARRCLYLYPWSVAGSGVIWGQFRCARCAGLRWASEGRATRSLERRFERWVLKPCRLRRNPWDPIAVSDVSILTDHNGIVRPRYQTGRQGPYR